MWSLSHVIIRSRTAGVEFIRQHQSYLSISTKSKIIVAPLNRCTTVCAFHVCYVVLQMLSDQQCNMMMVIYSCSIEQFQMIISSAEKIPTTTSGGQNKCNPKSFKPLKSHICKKTSSNLIHDKTNINSKKYISIKIVTVTFTLFFFFLK